MKCVTTITAKCLTILFCLGLLAGTAAAEETVGPSPQGLYLHIQKTVYQEGEMVMFKLTKSHDPAYSAPANLEGSYYRIARKVGDRGREFYTSEREPCGKSFSALEKHIWSWNQKDNEQTHEAQAGQWRLRFYAPAASSEPLEVYFRIDE